MGERLTRKALAKTCKEMRDKKIEIEQFDMYDGTHQFLELFTSKEVQKAIKDLQRDPNGFHRSSDALYAIIDKIKHYGQMQTFQFIIDEYYLHNEITKEKTV